MELSSQRFKALAVTAGFSLWFFIITSATGLFSIELEIVSHRQHYLAEKHRFVMDFLKR